MTRIFTKPHDEKSRNKVLPKDFRS